MDILNKTAIVAAALLLAGTGAADPSRNRGGQAPSRLAIADAETVLGTESSDASLTALVKSRLATNVNTRDLRIDVDTKNGVVRLRGAVWSPEERDLAELLARNTESVAMVQNDLIVLGRGVARR